MKKCDRPYLPAWLQDVPGEWPVPLLRLVARVESGHTPSRGTPEYWAPEECTIPWFSLADIWQLRDGRQKYLSETKELISPAGVANSAARVLPPGTVILSRTASVGFSGIMPKPMATTQDFVNFVCGDRLVPDYLLWVLRGMKTEFERLSMGSTHMTIYMPDLMQFRTPLPPLHQQLAIVEFLDRKTAAIGALIEKKERLIALLAEKRTSLIHHAVTKGLNPAVLTKDSGIEPLGKIPQHWEVLRNKNVFREIVDLSPTGEEELLSVSHITGVTPRSEKEVTMFMAESTVGYKRVVPGDLVVNTMWAWMGALGVSSVSGIVSPAYGVYRIDQSRLYPPYSNLFVRTRPYVAEMTRFSKGVWTSRLRLYPEYFLGLGVVVPPLEEQRKIVRFVDAAVGSFEPSVQKLQQSVDRLYEYRQALITAAVTGQLDIGGSSP